MGKTSNKKVVQLIVEQCISSGMKHIVCSPGSRNAPLVISFDEHPGVTTYVIHDERSAAFFALGMAQQLNEPVGVVCTSGSATVNYYPAVTEAYYQCVPLVIISADRPAAWIDQGDGQTIVQENVFGKHVRYSCCFTENQDNAEGQWYVGRELAVAFAQGNGSWKGPIHVNIGLNEPLYQTKEREEVETRLISVVQGSFSLSNRQKAEIKQGLQTPKKLVIVGQHRPDEKLLHFLKDFANDTSVAVLVENTSNMQDQRFIHCIDRTLNGIGDEEMIDFAPDLLITVGGAVISKRIKAFLRKNKPVEHWKIGAEFPFMDTYQSLTHVFPVEAPDFFKEILLLDYERSRSNYGAKWKQKDYVAKDRMPFFFHQVPFSDIKVFETLLDFLPEGTELHMANSSVIRYCQLFDPISSVHYWSNRGTSGIDGSTSTAAGSAWIVRNKLHVLITGDVSFFYDSNALWNKYLGPNFRIILINNQGGGIFRIIPGPSSTDQLEGYFEAHHEQEAKELCSAFNISYTRIDSLVKLEAEMIDFYSYEENGRPKLMEIVTPGLKNNEYLTAFFDAIK
jgi:2-succinyl-5-enolpyruvyl-6-hydroxy-3-cyclohexene-1-carboxylate synthase